jgi:hypothetical protein
MFLRLNSNQRLDKGQKLEVAGKGHLVMQTDGNLVVYDAANVAKWATGTQGKAVTHVIMQTDGNLVIYNNTAPVWASDTWNVGANGGYFQIDLNLWNGRIYKANDTVAKELFGTVTTVIIQESTTLNVTIGNPTSQPLKFPRQQNWEAEICKALGMTGVGANYAALTEFQKAIGEMALSAAEVYFPAKRKPATTTTIQPEITIQQVIRDLQLELVQRPLRDALNGLIATHITKKLALNQNDAQSVALREWAVPVYRQIKVDAAIGSLKEYAIWKNNPCTYSAPGYVTPQDCYNVNNPYHAIWKTNKPPSDLLLKAGLAYACGNNDQIVKGVAGGIAAAGMIGGFYSIAAGAISLNTAFGGTSALVAAGATTSMAAWASILAGPVAVIAAAVLIGITQGVAIIEGEQAEWKLRQAIHAAMKENINIANIVADQTAGALFYVAAIKSAQDGWKAPSLEIPGEVTFFCEAGYVSKFYLTYTLNGQPKSVSTGDLSAGYWKNVAIPAAAKNIEVKGVMVAAGEHQVFKETLPRPTYVCYKTYGTAFKQGWNNDWPLSVGGEVSVTANQVKFFHQAGFVANFLIEYIEPGKTAKTSHNPLGKTAGWRDTHTIPANATNVRVLIQGATGLAWEPWRTTYEMTFPTPPNMCVKIYGTSLDQKWNNDCN